MSHPRSVKMMDSHDTLLCVYTCSQHRSRAENNTDITTAHRIHHCFLCLLIFTFLNETFLVGRNMTVFYPASAVKVLYGFNCLTFNVISHYSACVGDDLKMSGVHWGTLFWIAKERSLLPLAKIHICERKWAFFRDFLLKKFCQDKITNYEKYNYERKKYAFSFTTDASGYGWLAISISVRTNR